MTARIALAGCGSSCFCPRPRKLNEAITNNLAGRRGWNLGVRECYCAILFLVLTSEAFRLLTTDPFWALVAGFVIEDYSAKWLLPSSDAAAIASLTSPMGRPRGMVQGDVSLRLTTSAIWVDMMWLPNISVVLIWLLSVTLLPMALHYPQLFRRVGVWGCLGHENNVYVPSYIYLFPSPPQVLSVFSLPINKVIVSCAALVTRLLRYWSRYRGHTLISLSSTIVWVHLGASQSFRSHFLLVS